MSRSKSSRRWLREHLSDPHVKRSREKGYRSRASFKLREINERDRIIRPGMIIVDLGAAPGGWSQVAAELSGADGKLIAVDLLPMERIPGVEFVQGDFGDEAVLAAVLERLNGAPVDLVISDMAPNISGVKGIDQPRAMELAELALELALGILASGGDLLVKVFQGAGCEEFRASLKASFTAVKTRKPQASRARSNEMYLLARGFQGQNGKFAAAQDQQQGAVRH